MDERIFYNDLLVSSFIIAAVVFVTLFFFSAPYGRHVRKGWGLTIDNKLAWVLMEAISPIGFAVCFLVGNTTTIVAFVFLALWEAHYIHRAFIYPFSLRGNRHMPVLVIVFGLIFNMMNAYLNGRYIFTFSTNYTNEWLTNPRFILKARTPCGLCRRDESP